MRCGKSWAKQAIGKQSREKPAKETVKAGRETVLYHEAGKANSARCAKVDQGRAVHYDSLSSLDETQLHHLGGASGGRGRARSGS